MTIHNAATAHEFVSAWRNGSTQLRSARMIRNALDGLKCARAIDASYGRVDANLAAAIAVLSLALGGE